MTWGIQFDKVSGQSYTCITEQRKSKSHTVPFPTTSIYICIHWGVFSVHIKIYLCCKRFVLYGTRNLERQFHYEYEYEYGLYIQHGGRDCKLQFIAMQQVEGIVRKQCYVKKGDFYVVCSGHRYGPRAKKRAQPH